MSVCALLQHNQLKMKTKTKPTKKKIVVPTTVVSTEDNSYKRLNPTDPTILLQRFKKIGKEGSAILIGMYYKGSARLNELKGDSTPQNAFNASQRLVNKGMLDHNNGIYYLTDQGRNLVAPFIEYTRTHTPAY